MSVARFIADQRTFYRVPHTLACALLGVSVSWFYKWLDRQPTASQRRRAKLDVAVAAGFAAARGLHGSPRLHVDLRDAGWKVSEKTVADSMRRQGLVARRIKRRNALTRQDKSARRIPAIVATLELFGSCDGSSSAGSGAVDGEAGVVHAVDRPQQPVGPSHRRRTGTVTEPASSARRAGGRL